jgi:hypothetical protein
MKSESFGALVEGSGFLKKQVEVVTQGQTTPSEKALVIYEFVKNNIEWNGQYRLHAFDLKSVLEAKKGNSAEINLILVSMLQKAGIKANPVLISTRDHGIVRTDFPLASQFNYVIAVAEIDGKKVLLDATDRLMPMSMLPTRCLNGKGFIISEDNSGWISLQAVSKAKIYSYADISIDGDGQLIAKMKTTRSGYAASEMRNSYYGKGEAEYVKKLSDDNHWELQKTAFENTDKISAPVTEVLDLTLPNNIQEAGDRMYINPILTDRLESNPFKSETREYPVDFATPFERTLSAKIILPESMTIDALPQTKIMALPENAAKYVYSVSQVGNTINLTSQLSVNKTLFLQEEYKGLRQFFDLVIAKQSEQIVIKRK